MSSTSYAYWWQKRCREGDLLDTGVARADIGIANSFRINAELL